MNRADLMALTKARLSLMVLVTTFIGFWAAARSLGFFDWWLLVHTLIGSALAAAASSVFNQLIEIDVDAKMKRTADRPLPARKISPTAAFVLGWVLAALGLLHLAAKVNTGAALLTGLTLVVYVFIYTPMKQKSSFNTIVGAISGGIPPMIGWVAAAGKDGSFMDSLWTPECWFLFGLLFLWQLPHFVAINWMYREQYRDAGFVMWSNNDETGAKTANLAILFSAMTVALMFVPWYFRFANIGFLIGGILLSGATLALAVKFRQTCTRQAARKLFLYTLIYLPLVLFLLILTWKGNAAS
ncbi:MAG: protoheme IX farnesyltransferase [Verrucomicrobiales bacterium]|jgi:protoheme IX farnesyltransferase